MARQRSRGRAVPTEPTHRSHRVELASGRRAILDAAYPATSEYDTHLHEEGYLCFVMAGSFDEWIGGRRRSRCAGAVVLYGAGSRHAVRTGGQGLRLLHVADPDGSAWSGPPTPLRDGFLRQLAMEVGSASREDLEDDTTRMHLESLVLELVTVESPVQGAASWSVGARDWLREEYARHTSLAALADRVGVHPAHFARGFRQAHGMTPGDFLRRVRVAAAVRAMVDGDRALAGIALACGFADQSHMGRYFKRYLGLSPGAVRRQMSGVPVDRN